MTVAELLSFILEIPEDQREKMKVKVRDLINGFDYRQVDATTNGDKELILWI